MSLVRATIGGAAVVLWIWSPARSFGAAQREPDTSIVIARTDTGIVGVYDRIVVTEKGSVSGALCVAPASTKPAGTPVKGDLDEAGVRELHALIKQALGVDREARRNPTRSFTYSVSVGSRLVEWEGGAAAGEIKKLETSLSSLLARLRSSLDPTWKCPFY